MEFKTLTESYHELAVDALIVPVFEGEAVTEGLLKELDEKTDNLIGSIIERREFRGKSNETAYIHHASGLKARRLLLVGVGKEEKFEPTQIRQAIGTAARTLRGKAKSLAVLTRGNLEAAALGQAIAEGLLLSLFDQDTYKTKDRDDRDFTSLTVLTTDAQKAELERGIERGRILGESTNFARELINEPSSNLTPTDMATRATEMAKSAGLTIDVLDEAKMKELGMGAILGVSRGSQEEAQLIVLHYEHPDAKDTDLFALVGKGITFDSGGISIKPSEGMEKMKYDMAGAAAVMGAMRAIAYLKPRARVVGVMACSENMPSGSAIKPGDILKSMSGQTIEVINTDAEGRLVLADAVFYAREKLGAKHIVDLATLTGAVSIALGPVYAALLGTSQQIIDELTAAGKVVGERYWQLPLDDEYGDQIRSEIADVKNTGGRPAGTITGAYFIKEFTGDTPWVHIDIASTAWNGEKKPYLSKGPTGIGVRTLASWIEARSSN